MLPCPRIAATFLTSSKKSTLLFNRLFVKRTQKLTFSNMNKLPGNLKLNPVAASGFAKNAESYDTFRPTYTDETVSSISEVISASHVDRQKLTYDVLELGAGTGKLTQVLRRALSPDIRYLASDPSDNFLAKLKEKNLKVESQIIASNDIPVADKSVGAIVCAQCFHWFAEEEDIKEIHRVLTENGKLILVWNMKNFTSGWMTEVWKQRSEIFKKLNSSLKYQANSGEWKRNINVSPLFKLSDHKSLPGIQFRGNVETVLSNLMTTSAYQTLEAAESAGYIDHLRQTIIKWPGIDLNNVEIPYTSELYIYSKV